jgi:hypothetical protein
MHPMRDDESRYIESKSMRVLLFLSLFISSLCSALETTAYGKIVGIETRGGAMHVQTDFAAGTTMGCAVAVGTMYMFDFVPTDDVVGDNFVRSVILSAFMAGKDISFHLYACNGGNSRPVIGHVRVLN